MSANPSSSSHLVDADNLTDVLVLVLGGINRGAVAVDNGGGVQIVKDVVVDTSLGALPGPGSKLQDELPTMEDVSETYTSSDVRPQNQVASPLMVRYWLDES
mmetsp:Transcript_16500/g.25624  ORF Transcript_16500/g.25624 Transcript_16500/m.25624 type:complete len:102 (-) Transcript_16500:343-648(-)